MCKRFVIISNLCDLSGYVNCQFLFLGKKGPIYAIDWNPNSLQFCVVYGCILAWMKLS